MIVKYSNSLGQSDEIECQYIEEKEQGVMLYDEYDDQIAYIRHENFFEGVPDSQ